MLDITLSVYKEHPPVLLTGKQFIDGVEWVYCCTFDSHTSQLMTCLSVCNYSEGFLKCIHIAAVVHMSSGLMQFTVCLQHMILQVISLLLIYLVY